MSLLGRRRPRQQQRQLAVGRAATGNDTRPNRVLNPLRQAAPFDPDGEYVRRYVPELESVGGGEVHRPWKLDATVRRRLDYPEPLVDLESSAREFLRFRKAIRGY